MGPRAARAAVFGSFAVNGAAAALWIAHIPVIKARLGLDEQVLGLALFSLAAGAVVAMQFAGPLLRTLGSRALVRLATVVMCAALVGPGLAANVWALAAALAVFGAGLAVMDVAMNAQAAEVERAYGRPIMTAFHAVWSLGGVVGAFVGSQTIRAGWSVPGTLGGGGALLGVFGVVIAHWLLRPAAADPDAPVAATTGRRRLPALVWLLGGLAFGGFLCEGAAADWAGVHLRETLGASASVAALGFAAFSVAMTTGRLLADRVVGAVGRAPVLRYGGALAAAGLLCVVFAPHPLVAIGGWVLSGVGLSAVVPQLFSAAANLEWGESSLARVTSLGYLGGLVGPAVIGFVAHHATLGLALLLLVIPAAAVSLSSPALRPSYSSATSSRA